MLSEPSVEVLTQPERRRRWSSEQKLAIVAETLQPGASATQVARRYGVSTGLLYTWRRLARDGALSPPAAVLPGTEFVPVQLAPSAAVAMPAAVAAAVRDAPSPHDEGLMVIELAGGRRIRVDRHVDAEVLRRVVAVLEGGR
jgi:transposase